MRICYTSYRIFADGPVTQPFAESDPANIAYVLNGTYLSFHTLKHLSNDQLHKRLRPYQLVIVALDVEAIELVERIVTVCDGRAATYSEGHIGDYQQLSPAGQVSFLHAINNAKINFLYWEKYVPFYRALTNRPVEYLPYPYLLEVARQHFVPNDQRQSLAALPSGLSGLTRNGLATLTVAKQLLETNQIQQGTCWSDPERLKEDRLAIQHLFLGTPFEKPRKAFNWRRWLLTAHIDYRLALKVKRQLRPTRPIPTTQAGSAISASGIVLHPRGSWLTYLAQLAPAKLMIDLNNRETVGRNALDCAALGIPCVSTNRSDMHARLFPQITLTDSWDIDGAVKICRRLLTDSDFYQQTINHAATAVQNFDLEPFSRRFAQLAGQYQFSAASP
jgi:hypothetical protein